MAKPSSPKKAAKVKQLQCISAREFAGRFANSIRVSQQSFTWFLGAGCSKSSGIPDAAGLVEKWLTEQHELQAHSGEQFENWARKEFPTYDPNNLANSYAKVFARRHPSPVERQREIEMICSRGEPAFGYATLAQILAHKEHGRLCNTVLTTNFDDLIADALYLYGERFARPLVVTHEALARYVRTNSPRPTVVKLHGDAHLDPKNLEPETMKIDEVLAKQLYPFLQDHALVFIGYGGNDQSILEFVQNCPLPALAPPIYWVSKNEPPVRFGDWLRQRSALRVDHTDFDQLMLLIRSALGIELLDSKRWSQIGDTYYEAFERLKEEIEKAVTPSDVSDALRTATSTTQQSLPDERSYIWRATETAKTDKQASKNIYEEGLLKFPNSSLLHQSYARFLYQNLNDNDGAEFHFNEALKIDPTKPDILIGYAIFLEQHRADLDLTEDCYKKALESSPQSAVYLAFYADFLNRYREQFDDAEIYFKKAIDADPTDSYILETYAMFLKGVRNDSATAEIYFKRAEAQRSSTNRLRTSQKRKPPSSPES